MCKNWLALIAAAFIASALPTSSSFAAARAPANPPPAEFHTVPSAPGPGAIVPPSDYKIGPQDTLMVDVFQVPDLSRTVQVETNGTILLPLIGQIPATGRTTKQLSDDIGTELGKNYVKDPLVTVTVRESSSQKVTIDGAVVQPGIYPIAGNTTLMQAVALARGPDTIANTREVAIFRNSGAQRTAAVFDLSAIRSGKAVDPPVYANDVIVVETSGGRRFLRDLGNVVPFISLFRPY
jgi:polysaccharide export outer membrane protein